MKKLLIGLGALVVLAVVILVAAPFFIPVDTYKDQIAERTREATGRALEIRGDFALSLLPRFELVAQDVVFANAPGADEPQMVTLKSLLVQLQVWPLLLGEIKVDSFVLIEPVIHLEVDRDGRANWDFGKKNEPRAETAETEASEDSGLAQISLGDVRLENGRVTYRDARTGQEIEISNINMALSLPDMDAPVRAEGSLAWNGETVTLTVKSGNLRGLMEGATTRLDLDLKSEPIALGYQGSITRGEPVRLEGDIRLNVPSIRALAAWTGNPIEAGGSGLGPLDITGKVSVAGASYAFTGATIALDEINATGDLSADLGGAKPVVKGRLEIDRIDLNAYLPPETTGEAKAADAAPEGGGAPAGWSEEPLDLSGLKAANVDFDLTVGAIQVREFKIGRSTVAVSLKDGLLVVELSELNLYGGSGSGRLTLDGRGEVPAMTKAFAIQGVQAQPLLTDAAGFDRLEGTGQFDISVSAKGRSQKAMVEALNGKGAVKFTDGAIKGINLAAMARNVGSAFLDKGARETQKTDFAELSGTFRITKGILKNDDLLMLNPLLRLTGKGSVDMPQRTVNYRLEPKVVGTLEGQGGAGDVGGVTVPVIVEGPWHDLQYRPDLAGMIADVVKDPAKALEGVKGTIEQLQKSTTGGLGQILKGVTEQPAEGGESGGGGLLSDPGGTLKKLFGN